MNSEVLSNSTAPSEADELDAGTSWLRWLSVLLNDRQWLGLFEFGPEPDVLLRRHGCPENFVPPEQALALARKARTAASPLAIKLPKGSTENAPDITLTALPLNESCDRILLIQGAMQSAEQQAGMFRLCQWAGERFDLRSEDVGHEPVAQSQGLDALPSAVLKASFEHETPQAMALSIVNTVKRLCGCSRVTLATLDAGSTASSLSIMAMSDQAQVDTRKVLPAKLTASMRERLVQSKVSAISADQVDELSDQYPHTVSLYRDYGENPSLGIVHPLNDSSKRASLQHRKSTQAYSVVLLERPMGQPFTDVQQKAIQTLLAPSLDLLTRRIDEQRSIWMRLRHYSATKLNHRSLKDMGIRRPGLSLAALAVVGSLLIPIEHRFTARAAIEAKDLQVIIAPQNGFVATSHTRAGESVKKGQLLATLDAQDLNLAVNKWESEKIKNEQAVDLALATRDRVALGRLRADTARIAAEQALVERQLERAELRAPFDGVVLSGDFSQRLGSAVNQGDTLFTIAATDEYRLVLDIKENDVGLVNAGQQADVRMTALPNQTWHASVESVLPVATSTEGSNVFRVPAKLDERPDALLPGMEGVAKVHAGSRSLAWVYTRSLREKAKVLAWRMGVIQ